MRTILLILVFSFCAFAQNKTYGDVAQAEAVIDSSGASVTRPIKSGTSLPATCSGPEMFFKTDAAAGQQLYTCAAGSWTQVSSGSGGLLAGACVSTSTQICIEDHFLTGTHANGALGSLRWEHSSQGAGGGDFILPSSSQPGAYGIFTIKTAATLNSLAMAKPMYNPPTTMYVKTTPFELTWRIVAKATADANVRMGLTCGSIPTHPASPGSGIYFEADGTANANNNWFAKITSVGNLRISADLGVAPPAALTDQFQTFRLRSLGSNSYGFSINGGSETTLTWDMGTNSCGPMLTVAANVAAVQSILIDYFSMKILLP